MTFETMAHFVNVDEVKKAITYLQKPGGVFEIRIIHTAKKNDVYSGYFKDADTMLKALQSIDQRRDFPYNRFILEKRNIYISLNTLKEDCFSRSQSECFEFNPSTTSDPDVTEYRWLFVDADPERTKGISSNEGELQAAKDMAGKIYSYMQTLGFKEPVKAMSGNGCHLLYRISVPNDEAGRKLVERCLKVLSEIFSTSAVKIDTTTSNPSRVCKLHGTLAQKGRNTKERPHRMSYIFSEDPEPEITPIEILQKLAAELPDEEQYDIRNLPLEDNHSRKGSGTFDLEGFLSRNGLTYRKGKTDRATKYLLDECPFDPSHQHGDARIFQYSNGAIAFKCHHNSCYGKRWQDVRLKYEPDAYSYEERKQEKKTSSGSGADPGQPEAEKVFTMPRRMVDIEQKTVEWLVLGYIPLNAISVLSADGGSGKTSIETALIAAISAGTRPFLLGIPTLDERDKRTAGENVLFLSGEDFAAYTLKEKVSVAGGDVNRVYVVDPSDSNIKDYCFGTDILEKAIQAIRPKLVVIDPLQSFLPETVNMIARNQMRQALIPIAKMAEKYNLAVIIATHTNKRDAASGRSRMSDSSDIFDIARSVLMVGRARGEIGGDVRYVSHEKCNWGKLEQTALFRIENGKVVFLRYTDKRDDEYQNERRVLNAEEKSAPKREEAEEFIVECLKNNEGHLKWNEIESQGKEEGIGKATMLSARQSLQAVGKIYKDWDGNKGQSKGTKCFWYLSKEKESIHNLTLPENKSPR